MSEKELETIRDMIYSASYSAEKYGFYLGIRTAITMLMEAIQLPDDPDSYCEECPYYEECGR